jgi:hypothetical protein
VCVNLVDCSSSPLLFNGEFAPDIRSYGGLEVAKSPEALNLWNFSSCWQTNISTFFLISPHQQRQQQQFANGGLWWGDMCCQKQEPNARRGGDSMGQLWGPFCGRMTISLCAEYSLHTCISHCLKFAFQICDEFNGLIFLIIKKLPFFPFIYLVNFAPCWVHLISSFPQRGVWVHCGGPSKSASPFATIQPERIWHAQPRTGPTTREGAPTNFHSPKTNNYQILFRILGRTALLTHRSSNRTASSPAKKDNQHSRRLFLLSISVERLAWFFGSWDSESVAKLRLQILSRLEAKSRRFDHSNLTIKMNFLILYIIH